MNIWKTYVSLPKRVFRSFIFSNSTTLGLWFATTSLPTKLQGLSPNRSSLRSFLSLAYFNTPSGFSCSPVAQPVSGPSPDSSWKHSRSPASSTCPTRSAIFVQKREEFDAMSGALKPKWHKLHLNNSSNRWHSTQISQAKAQSAQSQARNKARKFL